jgi:hypothetical protein
VGFDLSRSGGPNGLFYLLSQKGQVSIRNRSALASLTDATDNLFSAEWLCDATSF